MARAIDADRMKEELLWGNVFLSAKETNALVDLIDNQPTLTPPNEWVSVEDDMPPERDSIFKRFKGTPKWQPGFFEKISDTVNVAVEFEDGTRKTYSAHTADGEWRGLPEVGNPIVTHWMPLPAPPEKE